MDIIILGIALSFNLIVIMHKFKIKRSEDAIIDSVLLIALSTVFSGTIQGLSIATVASCIISLYLLMSIKKKELT